ncbi:Fur family transcriptional regulator [Pendulispora albinea]|uniref:Transcriptional repressor n=1 Tax=Pendulispora albinea TaxID=2741071 RepID=A0ABZ2LJP9_9BACT
MKSKEAEASEAQDEVRAERIAQMMHDLRNLGLKLTPQRRAIVEQFACDLTHPTAQELFDRLHREFPSMSFATVYNTLDALTSANLAGTLRLDGHAARFDPNRKPHHHAVCDECGVIVDIPADSLTPSEEATISVREHSDGFHVRAVEQVYRGLCGACARKTRA